MKKLVCLIVLTISLNEGILAQDLYTKVAKEMCGCINSEAKGISSDTRNAIIKSATDGTDLQLLFTELALKDADRLMKDAELLQNIGNDIGSCTEKIDKKFPELKEQTGDSDEQTNKLLEALSGTKGCEFTWALMILGQQSEEEEGDDYYYDE